MTGGWWGELRDELSPKKNDRSSIFSFFHDDGVRVFKELALLDLDVCSHF
jgi:hypothetical protein